MDGITNFLEKTRIKNPNKAPKQTPKLEFAENIVQSVGPHRDRTGHFAELRHKHLGSVEEASRRAVDLIPQSYHKEPKISPVRLLTLGLATEFCKVCGYEYHALRSRVKCGLCDQTYCEQCVHALTPDDVPGFVEPGRVFLACPRCLIVITKVKRKGMFKDLVAKHCAEDPVALAYANLSRTRNNILLLLPRWEPLAVQVVAGRGAVREEALALGKELDGLWAELRESVPLLPTNLPGRRGRLVAAIASHFAEFARANYKTYKEMRARLGKVQVQVATNAFVIYSHSLLEAQRNEEFWGSFGDLFREGLVILKSELAEIAIAAGEDWEAYKQTLQQLMTQYHDETSGAMAEFEQDVADEALLVRKSSQVLAALGEKLMSRLGPGGLPKTRYALATLQKKLAHNYAHFSLLSSSGGSINDSR